MGYLLDLLDRKISPEPIERSEARHYDINDKNDQSSAQEPLMSSMSFMSCSRKSVKLEPASPTEPDTRTAEDWRADYAERATSREYDGHRSRADAERLAWGEMQNEWHRLRGERSPVWQCAGCLKPLSGDKVFMLPDGTRAHDDLRCIATYGKRWRSAATVALVKLGLPRPATAPEDEP